MPVDSLSDLKRAFKQRTHVSSDGMCESDSGFLLAVHFPVTEIYSQNKDRLFQRFGYGRERANIPRGCANSRAVIDTCS